MTERLEFETIRIEPPAGDDEPSVPLRFKKVENPFRGSKRRLEGLRAPYQTGVDTVFWGYFLLLGEFSMAEKLAMAADPSMAPLQWETVKRSLGKSVRSQETRSGCDRGSSSGGWAAAGGGATGPDDACACRCPADMWCAGSVAREQLLQLWQHQAGPQLCIKPSANKGLGLFADEFLADGSFVGEYCGEVISLDEAKQREEQYKDRSPPLFYLWQEDPTVNLPPTLSLKIMVEKQKAAAAGRPSKVQARSKQLPPQAVVVDATFPGEELTFDYDPPKLGELVKPWDGKGELPGLLDCHCGAKNCRWDGTARGAASRAQTAIQELLPASTS
eukprot:gene10761-10917_t